jgi:hypothetical protein
MARAGRAVPSARRAPDPLSGVQQVDLPVGARAGGRVVTPHLDWLALALALLCLVLRRAGGREEGA